MATNVHRFTEGKYPNIFTGIADTGRLSNMKWEFGEYYSSLPVIYYTYFSVPKEILWTGRSFGLYSASASRLMKGLVCV